jgi:DNA (cytosine-5)-methyltransferase 1
MTINIVDLFSGPGGLGEGFAQLDDGGAFRIAVSAEMEQTAHATLTLRAFFRNAKVSGDTIALDAYYGFCNGTTDVHPRTSCPALWKLAQAEARRLTLGDAASNEELDQILAAKKLRRDSTVLIGGPPCQAYSLVGRARNRGTAGYVAESDHRHYLYREYLRILANIQPAVFVMENVKGIISSTVGGRKIFHDILNDLRDPVKATTGQIGPKYVIRSLVMPAVFTAGMDPEDLNANDFIICSEEYGIPQARHRVILLGVRSDLYAGQQLLEPVRQTSLREAIKDLPALRSKLSVGDSAEAWEISVRTQARELAKEARKEKLSEIAYRLSEVSQLLDGSLSTSSGHSRIRGRPAGPGTTSLDRWLRDSKVHVWMNHDARSHMPSDLGRYLYASVFAEVYKRTPKGHKDFPLSGLAPDHKNWESGVFVDRFRVQRFGVPSTTITSHIAKDGHYFIHPDPIQCRSLTVREAARLQTFPDNYFFEGPRTDQYRQVGNAVPPLLANAIARIVRDIMNA